MEYLKAVIVDDEKRVVHTIETLLSENFPEIQIVGSAGTVKAATSILKSRTTDILFLDIELPDGTGFDILKSIPSIDFKIIFVTGHDEFALKAIKLSAFDYLLKPIDKNELKATIERAKVLILHDEELMKLKALQENLDQKKQPKRIILKTAESIHFVAVAEIVRAEADSNYTRFFLSGGKKILVSKTLKEFVNLLEYSGMIRVHQSHLVNVEFIDRIVKTDGGYIVLKNGTELPVSPILKKTVIEKIKEFLTD